ncbi:MAG TPA: MucR family transcriptional regulator [Arenibaculum sp.]|nr:MucR family transcriptional regulator [Arenibaculum sp.]
MGSVFVGNDAGLPAAPDRATLIRLTVRVVSAYLRHSPVPAAGVPSLVEGVFGALARAAGPEPVPAVEQRQPAVPVGRSVRPDHIVCLEDGKKLKMLKRHLWTKYRMTPEDYRRKWDLSPEYPMVAPDYARQRSRLAKEIGLGRARRDVAA